MTANFNIASSLQESFSAHPDNEALVAGAERYTYRTLRENVRRLAGAIRPCLTHGRVGIAASRSAEACIGILATAWAGGTYVPINLKSPEARLIELFERLELDALIVDWAGEKLLTPEVEKAAPGKIFRRGADRGAFRTLEAEIDAPHENDADGPAHVGPDHLAYIEFTSGTTGKPKGVMVPTGAVESYLDAMTAWYDFGPDDRAAETCDITFDLSVHNMLTTWKAGATLHVLRPLDMVVPARFIRAHGITTWLSVPSVVTMARKTGGLAPDSLPSLRISLFCGEPLPVETAEAWSRAAPNSIVDNIYGPTEATIACLRQPWTEGGLSTRERGIVAIGRPYPGMEARIVDAGGRTVADGERGEIALAGAQLARGYFGQPELTAERFPVIDDKRWYLTGDRGYRDADGVFHHLGRLDNQIKLHGHRIELEEIDMGLRDAAETDTAAAVAWPMANGTAEGVVGFYVPGERNGDRIRESLRKILPPHMVPGRIQSIDAMPLNANGKIDRNALTALLQQENSGSAAAS
ncbi:AMP-binding protein [Oricola cellulosilytica]|nr:AMP-binding protein [Oricola cellulosilytica]